MRICGVCSGEREPVWWMMAASMEMWAELTQVSSGRVKDRPALGRTSVTNSSCWGKGAKHWLLKHHLLHLGTMEWVCSWWQKNKEKGKEKKQAGKVEELKMDQRSEFGCGKQNKWYKGRQKCLSPRGRDVRAIVSKKDCGSCREGGKGHQVLDTVL